MAEENKIPNTTKSNTTPRTSNVPRTNILGATPNKTGGVNINLDKKPSQVTSSARTTAAKSINSSIVRSDKPSMTSANPSNISKNLGTKPAVKSSADNLDKKLLAEDKEEEKKKKKKFLIIFFIIFIILALLVTTILLISSIKPTEIKFSVETEGNVDTGLYDENNNLIGTLKYLPGDTIDADMNVIITNLNSETVQTVHAVYLRVKIDVYVGNNYYSGFFDPAFVNSNLWTIGDDGYFYYNLKSHGNETINVFDELELVAERNNNVLNGKSGKLVLTAEILEANYFSIGQEWHTSPNNWRELSTIKG